MKTVLIMGINGGFGGSVAQGLARQGWRIRALMREPTKLPERFAGTEVYQGDASNIDDVRMAAKQVDLVVYAVNPANYDWDNKALPWVNVMATVAEEQKLNLIFPGNVYNFDPKQGPDFDETKEHNPISAKGKIRKAMENRLKQASSKGAKVVIVRCGDFIGENLRSAWLPQLVKEKNDKIFLTVTGDKQISHTWAYLPDVAKTVAELATNIDSLLEFNVFHFKGQRISFIEIAETLERIFGKKVVMKSFPWLLIGIISPFSKLFSGLIEMRYLWKYELNLIDKKLTQTLGHEIQQTELGQALVESKILTNKSQEASSKQLIEQ